MGGLSIWHWMIVLVVMLLLFGSGKVSTLMGDVAKGMKTFKKDIAEGTGESMKATAEPSMVSVAAAPKIPVSPTMQRKTMSAEKRMS